MRVINLTSSPIVFTDLDRGLGGEGTYLDWNGKSTSGVSASGRDGYMDVQDTDRVMLSAEMGQVKKFKNALIIDTAYSMTGNVPELFNVNGLSFKVKIGAGAVQTFTLSGTAATADTVSSTINATATGFVAEVSPYFFRSSFVDNITDKALQVGELGDSMSGARGPSIVSGFVVLVSDGIITVGNGTANEALGFLEGNFTKAV